MWGRRAGKWFVVPQGTSPYLPSMMRRQERREPPCPIQHVVRVRTLINVRLRRNATVIKVDHIAKQRRTAARRHEEATDVFRERYRVRGGIEGTNSGLKPRTGLGRVRVRGGPRVFHPIHLKITGWNILRASVCAKMREIVHQRAQATVFWTYSWAGSIQQNTGGPSRRGSPNLETLNPNQIQNQNGRMTKTRYTDPV